LIGFILYFIVALSSFGIAYIFFKTRNGIVRKATIAYFISMAYGTLIRAFWYLFPGYFNSDLITVVIILPLTIITVVSFLILWFKYYKKEL